MYDIWSQTTDELLVIKGLGKEKYKEEGKQAWRLIMECAEHLKETKATAAFWAVWGSCQVTYKELAEKFTKNPKTFIYHKGGTQVEGTFDADRIKSLVDDAKDQISKGLNFELELLKRSYARKSR